MFKYSGSNTLTSLMQLIKGRTDIISMLAAEANFKSEAMFRAYSYAFDTLCIEDFSHPNDIANEGDAATILANYYDEPAHIINKTSTDTLTMYSRVFPVDNIPYKAWIYLDYDGEGTVTASFSKNSGGSYKSLSNDTLTDIDALVQKNVKIKIVLSGKVRLKNLAWGCK